MEILDRIGRDKVIFTGYIPHEELPKYYALADLVVLPSTCEEAAGLTVIEAMMMQRPVITTTMGGIPEYTNPECAVLLENDEYFVMGDNCNNSEDSRSGNIGPVSRDMIEGRAWFGLGKGVAYSGFIK